MRCRAACDATCTQNVERFNPTLATVMNALVDARLLDRRWRHRRVCGSCVRGFPTHDGLRWASRGPPGAGGLLPGYAYCRATAGRQLSGHSHRGDHMCPATETACKTRGGAEWTEHTSQNRGCKQGRRCCKRAPQEGTVVTRTHELHTHTPAGCTGSSATENTCYSPC